MRYQIDFNILYRRISSKLQDLSEKAKCYVRCEWGHTNTSTNEQHGLILQEVLACASEGAIHHNPRQDTVDRWGHYHRTRNIATFLALTAFSVEIASEGLGKRTSEVTNDSNVHGDVIFLRRTVTIIETRMSSITSVKVWTGRR